MRPVVFALLAGAGLGAALPARAQSLAERVARAPDGTARFSFAARSGVCGNGHNISVHSSSDEWVGECEHGPVHVSLSIADHRVQRVRTYVGGHWRHPDAGATDLGTVGAADAAHYLISLADRVSRADDAILGATLADSVTIWPDLLRIARSPSASSSTRKSATFWLGQAAGDAATRGLDSLASDSSSEREVRKQAVFALSQRPNGEGVPALLRAARTNDDPAVRRNAIFWLGQSDDPRALGLFEELLAGPR